MLAIYQVDAFSAELFSGNPAAVVPLMKWLSDEILQKIAAENKLSETAFFVVKGEIIEIRWFTPVAEVNLCGHATLAAAHILFTELGHAENHITFSSKSGDLVVLKIEEAYKLNFPADMPSKLEGNKIITDSIGRVPLEVWKGKEDYLAILENQAHLEDIQIDFQNLLQLNARGLVLSAKGKKVDFVSRCFYPRLGVPEDPVTGSAHTLLASYWSEKLNKTTLSAAQLSPRGGKMICAIEGNRVMLYGCAITYMKGEIVNLNL